MQTRFVTSVLLVLVISFTPFVSFTLHIKAQESYEEYSLLDNDMYAQNYDENYFKDNAIKINVINKMVNENNRQLSTQDLLEDKEMNRSRLLASESKIAFVLPLLPWQHMITHFIIFFQNLVT